MKYIFTLVLLLLMLPAKYLFAQSTYFAEGSKDYNITERLEILLGRDSVLNFSTLKPYNRKQVTTRLNVLFSPENKSAANAVLSATDRYNLQSLLGNNSDWANSSTKSSIASKPLLKTFYVNRSNFFEVNVKDFFLTINPVVQIQYINELKNKQQLFSNTRGLSFRGMIANRIGFYSYITDNQERQPLFIQNYMYKYKAVPGTAIFKDYKARGGVDYFDARGGLTFHVTNYIDFQFAYDKNFIGNGYRSLFLSDFSAPYLFLKINTRIWKFNYENLFMQLTSQFDKREDKQFKRKYAAMKHLSINATPWLNVGFFEAIVFKREKGFDISYVNPVIFLQSIEGNNGGTDNALIGFDAKANVAHKFQFYGELMLDEFKLKEVTAGKGWWANKYAYQLGMKYINVAGIHNLDLQLETNYARPFTYSHRTDTTNYSHYNMPLAHPLGASFKELIAIVKYQPSAKWYVQAKLIAYTRGNDTGNSNYGSDILKLYTTRSGGDYGYGVGDINASKALIASFYAGYELFENLFIEGSVTRRNYKLANQQNENTTYFNLGIRMNLKRREFDF